VKDGFGPEAHADIDPIANTKMIVWWNPLSLMSLKTCLNIYVQT
jgi:hypothetical protein